MEINIIWNEWRCIVSSATRSGIDERLVSVLNQSKIHEQANNQANQAIDKLSLN